MRNSPTAPTRDAVLTEAGSVEATMPLNMPSMTLAAWTCCMGEHTKEHGR